MKILAGRRVHHPHIQAVACPAAIEHREPARPGSTRRATSSTRASDQLMTMRAPSAMPIAEAVSTDIAHLPARVVVTAATLSRQSIAEFPQGIARCQRLAR